MGFEAVLAALHRLVGMAGLGVDGGDHPVRGRPFGDAPPPIGAIGIVNRFYVLAGDQRQLRDRFGSAGTEFLVGHMPQHAVGIADQRVHQRGSRGGIIPADRRFPRIVVIMGSAVGGDHLTGAGHLTTNPTDRPDQLGHGVLGGYRVVEDREVQGTRVCVSRLATT